MRKFSLSSRCTAIGAGWLLGSCAILATLWAAPSDPLEACEVFTHPEQFEGKRIQIRGVFAQYTHGAYLLAYPKCEGQKFTAARIHANAEIVRAWRDGGGFKGLWMLSVMTGTFDTNFGGGHEFFVESLTVLRRVERYEPYAYPK